MSLEVTLRALLEMVVPVAYSDESPEGATYPLAIYQQVGGKAGWYVDNTMPDRKHARVQIYIWATTRPQASDLARSVEDMLCAQGVQAGLVIAPIGAFVGLRQTELDLYGTRQDFSMYYADA